jgi:hypothetical protein
MSTGCLCWSQPSQYRTVGTDYGIAYHWSRQSVAIYRVLIRPCVLFKFKFNRLNLKISRFYCLMSVNFEKKNLKKIKFRPPIHL